MLHFVTLYVNINCDRSISKIIQLYENRDIKAGAFNLFHNEPCVQVIQLSLTLLFLVNVSKQPTVLLPHTEGKLNLW